MRETDERVFDRADAHIRLANDQVNEQLTQGEVSASMIYATPRFHAWATACGRGSAEEMEGAKAETVEVFVGECRQMLAEDLDDGIANFRRCVGGG